MKNNELIKPLLDFMRRGQREEAYIWFREHQDKFSNREKRLIRAVLSGRLWRAPALLAVMTLALQVTAGGIKTEEFNPQTLESRLIPGLYAAGEVLDIDGDCGGYNLQWAWASGRLAGRLQ